MIATLTRRGYELDGVVYPRVSTILNVINKPFLATWRGKVGNPEADRIAKEATDFGTAVHALCDTANRSSLAEAILGCPDGLLPYIEAYSDWYRQHVRRVVATEQQVISRRWQFAGTADLLVELHDGSLALADIKTSGSLSETYALQLAAYRLALAEDGLVPDRRLIVWLPRKEPGVCRQHEYPDHPRDEKAFLHALAVYRWQQAQREDAR